jgi:pimeloyl-ACP methyl ester carboxylesterase
LRALAKRLQGRWRERALQRQHRVAQVGSATVHSQIVGSGPPVVLVHGMSGSARWWGKNVRALASHFELHIVDLIGFGKSRGHRFVLSEAADSLHTWMGRLGVPRASLVGHSMGGFIVADMAARFPETVDRLVLVNAAALPFDYGHLQHAVGLARALPRLPLGFLTVLATDSYRAGPLTLLRAGRQLLRTDIRHQLAAIQAPTLLIWGERDSVVPPRIGRRLAEFLPHATLVVIKGAGHVPMWEQPSAFNAALLDFLTAPADTRPGAGPVHTHEEGAA